MIYLDTNVFLYASEPKSRFYSSASLLLENVADGKVKATTSVENIQEIIHVAKKAHKLASGIGLCRSILILIPDLLPVNQDVIKQYLAVVKKYPKLDSRDCIHLAACRHYRISTLVTEDVHLSRVKEISAILISQASRTFAVG